jgi:hypothetical protein
VAYIDAVRTNTSLVTRIGEGNAHLIWALGLYLEEPDLENLASESLTDGPDDKKLDFVWLERDSKRLVLAQGYYAATMRDSAPANKASDLNTAAAWLFHGDLDEVPEQLRTIIAECRDAIDNGDIETIDMLYVHNLPESVNVNRELQTVAAYLRRQFSDGSSITVVPRELGSSSLEFLFESQDSHIEVKEDVPCPSKVLFRQSGPDWEAAVLSVPGEWLHDLFVKYDQSLFSANYRGFLGITRRRKINTAIRSSAEGTPDDFWVYNNGITLLTLGIREERDETILTGVSIINGAQTTGSIGSVDRGRHSLENVRVLCRVIQSTNPDKINSIVKYNNTQNEITTWDQYSGDPDQLRIEGEFSELGFSYSRKRGFRIRGDQVGIEDVAKPLLAFQGRPADAYRGKNTIFERRPLYELTFKGKKARHILLVHSFSRAIDELRLTLKQKSSNGTIIEIEQQQLALLRNLRFKFLFLALIARVLEPIVGWRVIANSVAFRPDVANVRNRSVESLVAECMPVVAVVLSFVAANTTPEALSELLTKEERFNELVSRVSAMIYAVPNPQLDNFKTLVTAS